MSNIIKHLKAVQLHSKYPVLSSLSDFVKVEENFSKPVPYAFEYSIRLTLERKVRIDEREKDKLNTVKAVVRKNFAEHVFGEFRPLINNIVEIALECPCTNTREKLLAISENFLDKMFVEGIDD